jgi:hypothetical protein
MATERFISLPIGYVLGAEEFSSLDDALAAASKRAGSDRTPRAVLRVVAEVQPNTAPQVHVNRFDHAVSGEEATNV